MLEIPVQYDRDTSAKFKDIFYQFPASLLGVLQPQSLVDESGMTHMGTDNLSENGCSAWDALYDTTP
jgi:hypothetical protein